MRSQPLNWAMSNSVYTGRSVGCHVGNASGALLFCCTQPVLWELRVFSQLRVKSRKSGRHWGWDVILAELGTLCVLEQIPLCPCTSVRAVCKPAVTERGKAAKQTLLWAELAFPLAPEMSSSKTRATVKPQNIRVSKTSICSMRKLHYMEPQNTVGGSWNTWLEIIKYIAVMWKLSVLMRRKGVGF